MSAILDALLKLAGGEKLSSSSDYHSRTAIAPQDRVISFTTGARAPSSSEFIPRTPSGKLAKTQVERKPSSRVSVPPTISETPQTPAKLNISRRVASQSSRQRRGLFPASKEQSFLGMEERTSLTEKQTASSQTSTPVKSASSADQAGSSPHSPCVASGDNSMTTETSLYTATEHSSPTRSTSARRHSRSFLQRRALAGVSGDSQSPSRPPVSRASSGGAQADQDRGSDPKREPQSSHCCRRE